MFELEQLRRQLGQAQASKVEKTRPLVRLPGDPLERYPFPLRHPRHVSPTRATAADIIHGR
jgi:hypothetical protein